MNEEAPSSPRGAQLIMLGFAASMAILSDKTEAAARLEEARRVLGSWRIDARAAREQLADAERSGPSIGDDRTTDDESIADLPERLTIGWIDKHRLAVAGGAERRDIVYARRYRVRSACPALARLCLASGKCDTTSTWRAVRVVDEQPRDGLLREAWTSYCARCEIPGSRKKDKAVVASMASAALNEERQWGPGASRARASKANLEDAKKTLNELDDRDKGVSKRLETAARALQRASDDAHNAAAQPDGRGVLVSAAGDALFTVLRTSGRPLGDDPARANREISASETGGDACASCGTAPTSPDDCLVEEQVELSPGDDSVPWRIEALEESGAWKDLLEDEPAAAVAALRDKETVADLEGEIFGIKVHSKDAVRWLWLPILALESYALFLLAERRRSRSRSSPAAGPDDRWTAWPCQLPIALVSAIAAVTSLWQAVHGAVNPPPTWQQLAMIAASALLPGWALWNVIGSSSSANRVPSNLRPPGGGSENDGSEK